MLRLFFGLITFVVVLASSERFLETRYIYALDKKLLYKGDIVFSDDKIVIDYFYPYNKSIEYLKNDHNPRNRLFYDILQGIYSEDKLQEELFFVSKEGNLTTLTPKEYLSQYIKKVEFKKDKKLDFLKLFMKNNDWIMIESP